MRQMPKLVFWIAASFTLFTPRNDVRRENLSESVIARRCPLGTDEAIQEKLLIFRLAHWSLYLNYSKYEKILL